MKKRMRVGARKALIESLCDGTRTCRDVAALAGDILEGSVANIARANGWPLKPLPHTGKKKSSNNLAVIEAIKATADGILTSHEIALIVGSTDKYVQRVMLANDLPRLPQRKIMLGEENPSWVGGRRIDLGGYVLVAAPRGHPHQRKSGSIYEHRLVLEEKIGRYLKPIEVVDHIDHLTIHNRPDNLRLFPNNASHLQATISGQCPQWSYDGLARLKLKRRQPHLPIVDTHRQERENGVVRLRTILRAWLLLDTDSPYLLGTHHWLAKAQIFDLSRPNLERHLALLSRQ